MKYKKSIWIWCGIGTGIFILGCGVFLYLFFIGFSVSTRNIADYRKIFAERGVRSGYCTFPEMIPKEAANVSYYHYYQDSFGAPTVETFLQCQYDEETYQKEMERLENTVKVYGNQKCMLLRDEENRYAYPAYIAVDKAAATYEYALLSGDKQITYILTMYGDKEKIHFDKKYLPKDYMEDEGGFGSGYSIYYASVSPEGIITDYSRDSVSKGTD